MRLFGFVLAATLPLSAQWTTVGGNAQHSGQSAIGAQPLNVIKWQTAVDQALAGQQGGEIFAHFGVPIITAANTVLVPVHATGDVYQVEVHSGATGALLRTFTSGWVPPAHDWVPAFGPGLSARNRFYFPDANGAVSYFDTPDTFNGIPAQIVFYGGSSTGNTDVHISTPIVSDRYGNIFFGFVVSGPNAPAGLVSGIARISSTGVGTWVSAGAASQTSYTQLPLNCAPALSIDSQTLYFAVSNGGNSAGVLVSVNANTLAPIAHAALIDPSNGQNALILDDSSASPVIGLDGDVYYGVFESSCCTNHDRGWLLHFNSLLVASASKPPGAFGWDDTPSIVPYSLVPSYTGHSSYLIFTKYNNYADRGGDGRNKIAILDPFTTDIDPITGVTVMKEVITILGQTPDGAPPAVREWCINSAAIDRVHKSAVVNSEDGKLYWWDFATNSFTQQITLISPGVGEAYTPTVIGPDGTVYAINDATLFAVGHP